MRVFPLLLTIAYVSHLPVFGEGELPPHADDRGEEIYAQQCASCHGENGEGVDEEYDEALWGNKSLESLTRYVHKRMPEEDEDAVVDEDAALVSKYIYDAFYSPEAQHRAKPPRVELLRLTNNQYRQSLADLAGSFGSSPKMMQTGGLKAEYFSMLEHDKEDRKNQRNRKKKSRIADRVDATISFDFGEGVPMEGANQQAFSMEWHGSLVVTETGDYDFRIRTHNGALFRLNSFDRSNDEDAFIDAYVSTGNTLQEKSRKTFLLGGRAYPVFLKYFSYEEKLSSIHLEWKPPHGVWEPIPPEHLSPGIAPPVALVTTAFAPDDRSLGYERGSSVSKAWQESTTYAAVEFVNHLIAKASYYERALNKDFTDPKVVKEICYRFAERAFRRPLTKEQRAFFVDGRFKEGKEPDEAMKESLLLILTSPQFLYPALSENEGPPDGYSIASRLALMLWDSVPDKRLHDAARQGKLQKPAHVKGQIRRMLDDPRARQKKREFFRHWLAMDEREDLGKDPKLYPKFDQRIVTDLRRSLETFVDEVVWSKESDYRKLLMADYLYLNSRLADFYKTKKPEGESGPEFVKTRLNAGTRAGIFTHPYLLSANAYHNTTSPIHRGVFLSRNVMGRLLKPPPEAVAFKDDEFDPSLTMREKVTQLTKQESCMQCHRVINPIGFSLENFDAVGRFRTKDNNKPVNTVSDYVDSNDEAIKVKSARDLAKIAVESEAAHRAFITHLFHHVTKQGTAAYGPKTLDELRKKFVDSGYKVRDLVVDITLEAALHHESADKNAQVAQPYKLISHDP